MNDLEIGLHRLTKAILAATGADDESADAQATSKLSQARTTYQTAYDATKGDQEKKNLAGLRAVKTWASGL